MFNVNNLLKINTNNTVNKGKIVIKKVNTQIVKNSNNIKTKISNKVTPRINIKNLNNTYNNTKNSNIYNSSENKNVNVKSGFIKLISSNNNNLNIKNLNVSNKNKDKDIKLNSNVSNNKNNTNESISIISNSNKCNNLKLKPLNNGSLISSAFTFKNTNNCTENTQNINKFLQTNIK